MTTDELLQKLPLKIGRNPIKNDGKIIGYLFDNKEGASVGWLNLHYEGSCWEVRYSNDIDGAVCLNPDNPNPPYNNAITLGDTPNEALQKMYDWLIENNFIKV